jgi:DNA-binding NtrC family response regulator
MCELLRTARRVASSDTSLLILGETGVGKEWLARAIHSEGPRSASPFVAVNCAAVPENLLESELFGHEKGAFTGAVRSRRGYFELAHRGTIFLDEIADMPPHLQVKLLRVLQDRAIQRLGGEKPIVVDVRVMAATNQDLDEAIAEKSFRSDLYYRLGVVTLTVPSLRDRPEDIVLLVREYLEQFSQQLGRTVRGIEQRAMRALVGYSWPGNVRELANAMERAVLLCRGSRIGLADLPVAVAQVTSAASRSPTGRSEDALSGVLDGDWTERPLRDVRKAAVDAVENAYLGEVLRQTRGRIGDTAERAGIDPRSLYDNMKRLGLHKEDFKG